MRQQINAFIQDDPDLEGALAGISVREAHSGENIYDLLGSVRLKPASNLKLLTAAAALEALGENYTFTTALLTAGSIKDGTLTGDLFLQGKGDPTLLQADFNQFAEKLREKGVTTIEGSIVADDTWYDNVRLSNDLVWQDEQYYYGAQISALTASPDTDYDAGTVIVKVVPGEKKGEKPQVSLTPYTDYIKIENQAKTAGADEEAAMTVEREHGKNTIIIAGEIAAGSEPEKEWISVWEPTGYALDLFRQALEENNITWTGSVKTGTTPDQAHVLLEHQSITLAELLVPFMKLSNNSHGEILVKEMGKVMLGKGSWEKGLEAMKAELEKLGINADNLLLRDGSGLSHVNLVTAAHISELLFKVQEKDWFPVFLAGLPVSGEEERMAGGTLKQRLSGIQVQAKTGTIDSVSTLSGYMETKSGRKIIFSILLNNIIDEEIGPEKEDEIVNIIYQNL